MITSRPPLYLPAVGALALGALFPVVGPAHFRGRHSGYRTLLPPGRWHSRRRTQVRRASWARCADRSATL